MIDSIDLRRARPSLLLGPGSIVQNKNVATASSNPTTTYGAWVEFFASGFFPSNELVIVAYIVQHRHTWMAGHFQFGYGASGSEVSLGEYAAGGIGSGGSANGQDTIAVLPSPLLVPGNPSPRIAVRLMHAGASVATPYAPWVSMIVQPA